METPKQHSKNTLSKNARSCFHSRHKTTETKQSNKWETHELITQLIFPFKTSFCNLVELAMIQITQNSISSHTIGVKIMKSPSGNPTHQGLSNNTKGALQFPYKKI
jgi:hypothetical protein